MDQPSDNELMSGIAEHNTQSFEILYARYAPRLLGFIHHIIPDRHESEDVLQNVFLYVWQHPRVYRPQSGSVTAFLFQVAKSRTVDFLRKNRRRRELTASEPIIGDQDFRAPSDQIFAESRIQVEQSLAILSREERLAIELMLWYGFTQNDVAEIMQRPLGTVKSWVRRGLAKLRQHYGSETQCDTDEKMSRIRYHNEEHSIIKEGRE
jgi:RNA polymerase sigma-70 factor (ECF subfamily)